MAAVATHALGCCAVATFASLLPCSHCRPAFTAALLSLPDSCSHLQGVSPEYDAARAEIERLQAAVEQLVAAQQAALLRRCAASLVARLPHKTLSLCTWSACLHACTTNQPVCMLLLAGINKF